MNYLTQIVAPPQNLEFLSEVDVTDEFARKTQACIRSREILQASKMKEAITNQTYELSVIKHLSTLLTSESSYILLVGS